MSDLVRMDLKLKPSDLLAKNIKKPEKKHNHAKPSQKTTTLFPKEFEDYWRYQSGLSRSCATSTLPDILISKCAKDYVVLDTGTKSKKELFHFLQLDSGNLAAQITAIKYLLACKEPPKALEQLLEQKINRSIQGDTATKDFLKRALNQIRERNKNQKEQNQKTKTKTRISR